MEMVFDQQGPLRGQLPGPILRDQRLEISAAADCLPGLAFEFPCDSAPYPVRGALHGRLLDRLAADLFDCLVKIGFRLLFV